jgi:hypothetical protein
MARYSEHFLALPEDKQPALGHDHEDHWAKYNRATEGTTWGRVS